MKRNPIAFFALLIALLFPTASLGCGIEAWNFAMPGILGWTNGNWTFGEVFVADRNIDVIFLGYYTQYVPLNFLTPHPVGLFDASGDLLASTVIDNNALYGAPGQPLIGGIEPGANFVFNRIPDVRLLAGQTYVIEGISSFDPYTWNDFDFQVYLPITIQGSNWVSDNGLNFNGTNLMNATWDGYWGANFGEGPEPGSVILLTTGVATLAAALRRKLRL